MIATLLAGLAAASSPASDPSPSIAACPRRSTLLALGQLPEPIRNDLAVRLPGLGNRDQPFQRTDNVREANLPRRRFVGGVAYRNAWVILYEHGIVDHLHAIKYVRQQTAGQAPRYVLMPNSNLTGPVCAILEASLAGVEGTSAGHF